MSKPFPAEFICFSWRSCFTDELLEWAVEYSPCMGETEAFEITTPRGTCEVSELDTMRGLHAMIGEAIKKAEEIPPTEFERKEN